MKTYGWYEYGTEPWSMRNTRTGQSIFAQSSIKETEKAKFLHSWTNDDKNTFFSKHHRGKDFDASFEIKLIYKDADMSKIVPITILTYEDEVRGKATPNEKYFPSELTIVINYNLLLEDSSFLTIENFYGRWRRVDDFLTDALVCWPDTIFDERPNKLIIVGGWSQGQWTPDLKRTITCPRIKLAESASQPIAESAIVPLDIRPPQKWHYIDKENPKAGAKLIFSTDNEFATPFLSATSQVEGFQDATPYLIREDKAAYIFVSKLDPSWFREDSIMNIWYTYVDMEIFFTFRNTPLSYLELGSGIKDYGFRMLPPTKSLWASDHMGVIKESSYVSHLGSTSLSFAVWKNMTHIIPDAWLSWKSAPTPRHLKIDNSVPLPHGSERTGYAGGYGGEATSGFSGGFKNFSHKIIFDFFN